MRRFITVLQARVAAKSHIMSHIILVEPRAELDVKGIVS
jgi:hypothetical protein